MVIAFGPFELDLVACELRREGCGVAMQPRVFDVLRYLVEHRDRIVSKQELLEGLWDGQQLNAAAVPWSVSHARKALGQSGSEQSIIKTFSKRGYRFVADVRQVATSIATGATPFVGRAGQLDQLTVALDDAARGRGGVVLVVGEAGIGKTRCAAEFEAIASSRNVVTWIGRCVDHGAAPACWPFVQIFRAALGDGTLEEPARREMGELLRELEPDGAQPAPPLTDTGRFWFLDRISRVLLTAAERTTRVLVIDDLHCADESSLRVLTMLSPMLVRSRLLVIATARDFSTTDGVDHGAALVSRLRPLQAITLAGLTAEDVAAYLQIALGHTPAAELIGAVHVRTGGNPMFVGEAVRTALERRSSDGSIRPEDVPLPSAAREFISQRLAPLDAQTRDILDAASVIGNEFAVSLLQRTCGLNSQQLLSRLHEAGVARLLESNGGVGYRFVHPMLRELAYSALSVARRAELHARVGISMEALAAIDANVQQLAFHFHHALGAEYGERASRYAGLAGHAAMRVYAYEEAIEFYRWALEAHAATGAEDRAVLGGLLRKLAEALTWAGQLDDARRRCEQLIALARESNLPELLVAAARLLRRANVGAQVPDPVALAALQEALGALPESATAARALVHIQLACIPPYAYQFEESSRLCDEGFRLARVCGDRGIELEALRARLLTLSGPDTPHELLALAEQLLDAESGPGTWWLPDAHLARYFTLLRLGRADAASDALSTFGRKAQALRVREAIWQQQRLLAHRALDAGSIDEAERRFEQLWIEARGLRLPYAPVVYSAQLTALQQLRTGRRVLSGPLDEELWVWARAIPAYRAWRVLYRIEHGEGRQARREFDAFLADGGAGITRDSAFLYTTAQLGQAAVALGDHDGARQVERLLLPHAECLAVSDFGLSLGSVSHHLGLLALFLGDLAKASECFDVAQRVNTATGHHVLALRSRLSLAEVLLTRSTLTMDRNRARTIGVQVREGARGYGALALQGEAERLLERLPLAGAGSTSGCTDV
jgi:DNA-binding winged helix-turn-helix (wHTH) protein/tetratricopeptide (TPR) repeat protein